MRGDSVHLVRSYPSSLQYSSVSHGGSQGGQTLCRAVSVTTGVLSDNTSVSVQCKVSHLSHSEGLRQIGERHSGERRRSEPGSWCTGGGHYLQLSLSPVITLLAIFHMMAGTVSSSLPAEGRLKLFRRNLRGWRSSTWDANLHSAALCEGLTRSISTDPPQ